MNQQELSSFIWSVADLLRGDYKPHEYGQVILPFTVLRRLDCVLEPTKQAVLDELEARKDKGVNVEPFLLRKAKQSFYNTSKLDMRRLSGDQDNIGPNLFAYIQAFSPDVRDWLSPVGRQSKWPVKRFLRKPHAVPKDRFRPPRGRLECVRSP